MHSMTSIAYKKTSSDIFLMSFELNQSDSCS